MVRRSLHADRPAWAGRGVCLLGAGGGEMSFVHLQGLVHKKNFTVPDIFFCTENMWSSKRSHAFGYYEIGSTAYLTFIKKLR